MHFAEAPMALL